MPQSAEALTKRRDHFRKIAPILPLDRLKRLDGRPMIALPHRHAP
jgi:hypothetical protein